MPTYEITAPNGKTLSITGDHVPNEAEMHQIFASAGVDAGAGAGPAPDFRASNEKDPSGNATVVDPNTVGTFAEHAWDQLNPLSAIHTLGTAILHPVNTAKAIGAAQGALYDKAKASYDKGDYLTAARHFVDYLIPLVGPGLDKSADEFQAKKWAAGGGDAIGLGLALLGPEAISAARAARATTAAKLAPAAALTPAEEASNAFAQARDIPLDAATATGSKFVRGVQKVSGESLLGAPAAERAQQAQAAGLTRVGGELADQAHPVPVTPEQAGGGVSSSIRSLMADLNAQASQSYDKLRQLESSATPETVPARNGSASLTARQAREKASTGQIVSDAERGELHRIQQELETMPYEGRTWTAVEGKKTGNAAGGAADIRAGHAGTPVHGDIIAHLEGDAQPSYSNMATAINEGLANGAYSPTAKAALDVARKRLAGNYSGIEGVTRPRLPDAAAQLPAGSTEQMRLAVDVGSVKPQLRPIFDRLMAEREMAPLMGGKAQAALALKTLLEGPDHAPLSTVDAALGDLKTLSRADIPELRTQGQSVAAQAVRQLDTAVRTAAAKGGPDVLQALEEGRAATTAKYGAADVFDQLRGEPVQVFRQMTAPKDSGIALLRQVKELAPAKMPEIGRAKLEELLSTATERDRFDHADKLYAEWQKLGPETKRTLFPGDGQISALDHFFLLAKRIAENPNSSGTAPTLMKAGEMVGIVTHPLATLPASLTMGALSKLLYSPRGVRALSKVMATELKAPAMAKSAVKQAAWIELANVARAADVPLAVPRAADRSGSR